MPSPRWNSRKGIDDWQRVSNATWGQILDDSAARYGGRIAIIFKDRELTFSQLQERVDVFANGLLAIGFKPGDNICLWMKNSPEWVIAQFAVYKIGARIVPINTRYCFNEVEYVVNQSECAGIIFDDELNSNKSTLDIVRCIRKKIVGSGNSSRNRDIMKHIICNSDVRNCYKDTIEYQDVFRIGEEGISRLNELRDRITPADVMCIQYTSGTTGFPKGVMCTHRSTIAAFYCTGVGCGYRQGEDSLLVALPLFTNAGALGCSATAILFGLTIVLLDQFEPEACLRNIARYGIELFIGSDNMFTSLLRHKNVAQYDISSLRGGIMAGGHNPVAVIREVIRVFPELTMVYGLTENSGLGTMVLYDDPLEKRLFTSGTPMPYTRVAIKDLTTGEILGNEREGEICTHDIVQNSSVMVGYFKMDKETREAIDIDGWLHTGDMGYFDADGYLVVTGRMKDMFTTGGNNVYPAEIENFFHTHHDVKVASVVGIPDLEKGSVPAAFVILNDGSNLRGEELIGFCRNNIASYKIPKIVEIVKELPLTSSGKVRKSELREAAIKKYRLESVAKERLI